MSYNYQKNDIFLILVNEKHFSEQDLHFYSKSLKYSSTWHEAAQAYPLRTNPVLQELQKFEASKQVRHLVLHLSQVVPRKQYNYRKRLIFFQPVSLRAFITILIRARKTMFATPITGPTNIRLIVPSDLTFSLQLTGVFY